MHIHTIVSALGHQNLLKHSQQSLTDSKGTEFTLANMMRNTAAVTKTFILDPALSLFDCSAWNCFSSTTSTTKVLLASVNFMHHNCSVGYGYCAFDKEFRHMMQSL